MILQEALEQAKKGRLHILGKMAEAIAAPREDISEFAPRIITIKINPEKIRDVIGKGGSVIRALTEETGAKIDVEDDGTITIATADGEAAEAAIARIKALTAEAEVWRDYMGRFRGSSISARSSRYFPVSTDCCTFSEFPTAASRTCGTS